MAKRRPPLTKDEIGAIVRRELDRAQGFDADYLSDKRATAYDYFFAGRSDLNGDSSNTSSNKIPTAPPGRSNVVSQDVADTTRAILAQSTDILKSSVIEFPPDSEDDEAQAQLESDFVAEVIKKNDAFKTVGGPLHDAVLIGNGWIKVYVESSTEVSHETIQGAGELAYLQAIQPNAPRQAVDVKAFRGGKQKQWEIDLERTTQVKRLKIVPMANEFMMFSPSFSQFDAQTCRFVAERRLYTVSELIDMGMTEQQALETPNHQDEYWPGAVAREGEFYESSDKHVGGDQEATHLKECFHCYLQLDPNNDARWELYEVFMAGRDASVVVWYEPVPFRPYVTGSPVPIPHRIQGLGMFDLMAQVQDTKTSILRKYVDNLEVMNSSRVVYNEQTVNEEDLLNGRINGAVRNDGPVDAAVFPLPNTDVGAVAIQGLDYMDRVQTQRGGAALDLNTAEGQIAKSSALAAAGEFASKEQMAGWYSSNLVHTLWSNLYLLVHQTLRTHMAGEQLQAKIRGKWTTTDPGQWKAREYCEITLGLTTTEKRQKQQGLAELMQAQNAWLAQGADGVLSSVGKVYNAAADWIRARDLGNPEEYLIDPESDEAKQAADLKKQQREQQSENMAVMQAQMMDFQARMKEMELNQETMIKREELRWKYYDTNVDAGVKEAGYTVDGIVNLEQARTNAQAQTEAASKTASAAKANGGGKS